jgi:hypothetical protein
VKVDLMVSKMASMKVAWMVDTKVALWESLMVDGMVVIAVEKLAVQLVASTVSDGLPRWLKRRLE